MVKNSEVHTRLSQVMEKCSGYLTTLESQTKQSMAQIPSNLAKIPAVYALWENGECVYIGRTRNLAQRLRGHKSNSTYSASFAVKRARQVAKLPATYKSGNSAVALLKNNKFFKEAFESQLTSIGNMEFSYIEISDMIEQYFFEPYATMHFKLPENAFGTH